MNNQAKSLNVAAIPKAMKERSQWVVWRYEPRQPNQPEGTNKKPTKPPYIAATVIEGRFIKARSNKPETWGTFDLALAALMADASVSGIGYCFSKEDGLVGIDLDNCFDEKRNLLPWGREIVDEFAGTYIEFSPSGDGLHIWCLGKAVKAGRRVVLSTARGVEEAVEIYDYTSPRYFTVTGKQYKEKGC